MHETRREGSLASRLIQVRYDMDVTIQPCEITSLLNGERGGREGRREQERVGREQGGGGERARERETESEQTHQQFKHKNSTLTVLTFEVSKLSYPVQTDTWNPGNSFRTLYIQTNH